MKRLCAIFILAVFPACSSGDFATASLKNQEASAISSIGDGGSRLLDGHKAIILPAGGTWKFPHTAAGISAAFPYGANALHNKRPMALYAADQNIYGANFPVPSGYDVVWYAFEDNGDCGGPNLTYGVPPTGSAARISGHFKKGTTYTLFVFTDEDGFALVDTVSAGQPTGSLLTFQTPFQNQPLPCGVYLLLAH